MVLIVSCLTLLADNSMSLLCRVYSTGTGITGTNSQIEDLVDEYRYELSTVIEFALAHAHHKVFKGWVNITSLCQKLRNWLSTNLLKILRIDNGASLCQPVLMSLNLFHKDYCSVEANNLSLFNIYYYPSYLCHRELHRTVWKTTLCSSTRSSGLWNVKSSSLADLSEKVLKAFKAEESQVCTC